MRAEARKRRMATRTGISMQVKVEKNLEVLEAAVFGFEPAVALACVHVVSAKSPLDRHHARGADLFGKQRLHLRTT
jgi:hypothetical protein